MPERMTESVREELESIRDAGLYKDDRVLESPQQVHIKTARGEVLNFCANNYLGLANHPEIIQAAKDALDHTGYGRTRSS